MIDPLKIVVCSLKSVKRLPCVKNYSLVMNTPASLDSPVANTPGSFLVNPPWFFTPFSAAVFQRPVAGLFLTLFRLLGKDFIFRLLLCVGYIL
jgi:hypothetical protein